QAGPHDGKLAGYGVEQTNGIRITRVVFFPAFLNERKVDDLLVIHGSHGVAQGVRAAQALGVDPDARTRTGRHIGQALEAIDTRHLFDQVFFDFNIEAIRRRHDAEDAVLALPVEVETLKDTFDLGLFDRYAQYAM